MTRVSRVCLRAAVLALGMLSLKFGLGYRKAPIMSFSHYAGGVQARVQCVGNTLAGCGDGSIVAPGASAGIVPFSAIVYRDQLRNNDWWSYNGYLQDSCSRGRWRLNGGLRYDWQQSKYLGGCVPANTLVPDLLPAQCEDATQTDASNGCTATCRTTTTRRSGSPTR